MRRQSSGFLKFISYLSLRWCDQRLLPDSVASVHVLIRNYRKGWNVAILLSSLLLPALDRNRSASSVLSWGQELCA